MKKSYMLLLVVLLMVITGCSSSGSSSGGSGSDPIAPAAASVKEITAFSLNGVAGTINETGKTIAIDMPFGTDVTALVVTFTTTGASVKVSSTIQISGTTANDFTTPVVYTVTAADGTSVTYTAVVTVATASAKAITVFFLNNVAGNIYETEKTIVVPANYGTDVTALVAKFTTTGVSVKVGSTVQISGTTANDFTNPVIYTVTAADATTQDYTVIVTVAPSYAKSITAFSLNGVVGKINETAKTISVIMPSGTSVTNLVATFTTMGASVKVGSTIQISGATAHNFTSPVTYTVVASNGSSQNYTVTVTVATPPAKEITAFSLNGVVGTIYETEKTITVNMPLGTDLTALVATFTTTGTSVKVGSTVQISGTTANDFTSPVTYTVTAADGSTQAYTVTVTLPSASDKAIKVFNLMDGLYLEGTGIIYEDKHLIVVPLSYAGWNTLLNPANGYEPYIIHTGVSVAATGNTNFLWTAQYTVTAVDGTTQAYYVQVLPPRVIVTFDFLFPLATGVIVEEAHSIVVLVPEGTAVTALVPTIIYTGESINPASGVAQNFTSPVTYTVTQVHTTVAGEKTTQDYTVTVKFRPSDYTSANIGLLKAVPAGTFQRGSTATNTSYVSTFRMSEKEITRAQWIAVTGLADPSDTTHSTGTNDPVQMVTWYHALVFCNMLSIKEGLTPVYTISGSTNPADWGAIPMGHGAINVIWDAAIANWSADGYRLPTEMEWMWAAMGGGTKDVDAWANLMAFAGYNGQNAMVDYAWFWDNSRDYGKSHPVGTKLPNELGLYDMSGNVEEWCWDWEGSYYATGALIDYRGEVGPGQYRTVNGGSWYLGSSSGSIAPPSAAEPPLSRDSLGFRVVRQ